MSAGQIIVAVLVVGFFGFEVYGLIRDILKKRKAKLEEKRKHEENKA